MSKGTINPLASSSDCAALYDQDFVLWLDHTVNLLRQGKVQELDLEHFADEIEAMGKREKRAIESNLKIILVHLLKYQYQPQKRSRSWRSTLLEHRQRIARALKDSPSLHAHLLANFQEVYAQARAKASAETNLQADVFPVVSPFGLEQALDQTYRPD
ncbi:MAG TPA: DUF29 domain-containing protein [Cyanobacteria bacterium UBA8156]|jgi:hypothetical protein|nr:DUF29 domain-containing protein [Cyanobacteria bacterium UBA8156]